jgi:hypothetical protein
MTDEFEEAQLLAQRGEDRVEFESLADEVQAQIVAEQEVEELEEHERRLDAAETDHDDDLDYVGPPASGRPPWEPEETCAESMAKMKERNREKAVREAR